jgi:predicted secreted protein
MASFDFAPFSLPIALAIFFTSWWICLFAVLPFGVRNHDEAREKLPEGADPGAPAAPMLLKKFLATTLLAFAVYALIVVMTNVMG